MSKTNISPIDKIIYEQEADEARHMYLMHWDSMRKVNYKFFQTHIHQSVEFIFCEEGELDFRISDSSGCIRNQQILIINSFNSHFYAYHGDFKGFILVISIDFIKDFLTSEKDEFNTVISVKERVDWDNLIGKLYSLFEHYPDMSYQTRKGNILLLIDILNKYNLVISKIDKSGKELSTRIFTYIEENYASNISLQSVAKAFCYSKNYFCSLFSDISKNGLSFNNYLNFYRVKKVLEMRDDVAYKEVPTKTLIKSCGFKSSETFYRSLKKYKKFNDNLS